MTPPRRPRKQRAEVLLYSPKAASRSTVRQHYARWREEHGLPPRCDNAGCQFHTATLSWQGQPLPLILDHVNGNNLDNSPKNLRYLCPNCDSQLQTRGGKNRGRVAEAREGAYVLVSRNGTRHFHLIAQTGTLHLTGHPPSVAISSEGRNQSDA